MDVTRFDRKKYGRELLIDTGVMSENRQFIVNDNQFVVDFFEIFIIRQGEGEFHLNDEVIPFKKGTLLFLPPGKVRRWGERTAFDAYYLIFEEEFIQRFFKDELFLYRLHFFFFGHPSYLQLEDSDYSDCQLLLGQLIGEIGKLREDSDHLLRSLLYQLLITWNRQYEEQHAIGSQVGNINFSLQFRHLLEANFKTHQTVNDYCGLLNTSKVTLSEKVGAAFGKTPGLMIKERVVLEAKQMLMYTDLTVSEIAYRLNFSDMSNFNRLFRKIVGVSPGQFRSRFTI